LYEDLIIIILAISIHYAMDLGRDMGNYSCPVYCEVKHKHVIKKEKLNDWFNGNNNVEGEKKEYLHRAK
jgi:hypothetical protein